jgi:hypothetical protein
MEELKQCTRFLSILDKCENPLANNKGELPKTSFRPCKRDGLKSNCKHCDSRDSRKSSSYDSKYKTLGVIIKGETFTNKDYLINLELQNSSCKLCNRLEPGGKSNGRFIVDHCHISGEFRGLICYPCNRGLGMLGDTVEGLEKALNYLKSFYEKR